MNFSFLAGAFTAWIAFTPEGKKFGDNITSKCMRYIRENYLVNKQEKKDDDDNKGSV